MAKFLCIYREPTVGRVKPSPEEMQALQAAWYTWMQKFSSAIVPGGDGLKRTGRRIIVRTLIWGRGGFSHFSREVLECRLENRHLFESNSLVALSSIRKMFGPCSTGFSQGAVWPFSFARNTCETIARVFLADPQSLRLQKRRKTRLWVGLAAGGGILVLAVVGGCVGLVYWFLSPTNFPAQTEDYVEARKKFQTKLIVQRPAPQHPIHTRLVAGAKEIEYQSGSLRLKAWVSSAPADDKLKQPAVLFLHGGFGFDESDWAQPQPFRDAGFVVMVPLVTRRKWPARLLQHVLQRSG